MAGDLDTHDRAARILAIELDATVVSVDYRRPPEARFPAAFDDAFAAVRHVGANLAAFGGAGQPLGVAGDSAGGNLAATGAVGWMFERRAVFTVQPDSKVAEERLLEVVLGAGAEDLVVTPELVTIYGAAGEFHPVKTALQQAGVGLLSADLAYVPKQHCSVADAEVARRVIALFDALEDHDDVQAVYSNEHFPDEVASKLAADA